MQSIAKATSGIQSANTRTLAESHSVRVRHQPRSIFPALLIVTGNGQDHGLGSRQRKEQVAEGSASPFEQSRRA
jgi:hypothetical protein